MRIQSIALISVLMLLISGCGGGGPTEPDDDVLALIQAGQNALIQGDGVKAASNFGAALQKAPNNPEANFGMAFVELMGLGNDIVAFLSAQNEPYFRNVGLFVVEPIFEWPGEFTGLLEAERCLVSYEDDLIYDDMTLEQIRQEIITLIGSLEAISQYLRKTINGTSGSDGWTFTVPEDWNDPSVGYVTLWRGDILTLAAALNWLMGGMHLAVAYSPGPLGIHQDEWGDVEITGLPESSPEYYEDTNESGYIELGEIADQAGVPDGFGVLAAGGNAHLSVVVTCWRQAFTDLRDAVDSYIAVDALMSHWGIEDLTWEEYSDYKADWHSYGKAYLNDLIAAFTGGAILVIRPQLLEDYPELADDPGTDFSVRINFAAFFTNMPNDLRDFPLRFVTDEWDELILPETPNQAFTDLTVLGLFPNGIPQRLYDAMLGED